MEALDFLKAVNRRYERDKFDYGIAINLMNLDFERLVSDVEEWAKEHPVKTRQTEFVKMFPNAALTPEGYINVYPCFLDKGIREKCDRNPFNCVKCFEEFWNEEVE